jgi:hypothetical protein
MRTFAAARSIGSSARLMATASESVGSSANSTWRRLASHARKKEE